MAGRLWECNGPIIDPWSMTGFARLAEDRGGYFEKQPQKEEERLMEVAKRKEIENRLYQLLLQTDQTKNKKLPAKPSPSSIRVIRRRKGKPDLYII